MKFKTRMINAAVAAALGTVAGAAQAVNLGNDGEGQVLIYPYYTTQSKAVPGGGTGPFNTLVSVINSDSVNGKAVKVRFLEGKNSREVLDFNLYLSPNDMWTASLLTCSTVGGANQCQAVGAPMLRTTDNSCTAPEIPATSGLINVTTSGTTREIAFTNFAYSGTNKDEFNDQTLGRAMEGYFEIIEMADTTSGSLTFTSSLHNQSNQVPANCITIRNGWLPAASPSVYTTATTGVSPPTGHLSGALTLINPLEGTDASVDAVAIENFSDVANHQAPGSTRPDLRESSLLGRLASNVVSGNNLVFTNWGITGAPLSPAIPVSAVLIRNQIINEYVVSGAPVGFQTDHVVTMPTKRFHQLNTGDVRPFTTTPSQNAAGTCEPVTVTFYNRDETIQSSQPGFSPPPPSQTNQLCFEANVLPINSGTILSNVLGTVNLKVTGVNSNFTEGFMRLGFAQQVTSPAAAGTTCFTSLIGNPITGFGCNVAGAQTTYVGLPVVGFAVEDFVNTSNLSSFATAYTSRYTRLIAPVAAQGAIVP